MIHCGEMNYSYLFNIHVYHRENVWEHHVVGEFTAGGECICPREVQTSNYLLLNNTYCTNACILQNKNKVAD